MIKRVGPHKYVVMDKEGKKRLSKPLSLKGAKARLREVEHFKQKDGG